MVDYFSSYVVTVLRPQIASPKQRGLVGWARWVGKGQKTQVVGLVAAGFSLSPLSQDPFKGLDVAEACLFSGRPACLSPRKFNLG